jgi:TATA-box binding protein (TBP) (component of TFIID and TFIIIB)
MRVRVKKDDKLVNIKLFSNGCLQLTGAKMAADAASVCRIVADKLFSAQQAEQSTCTLTSVSGCDQQRYED